MLRQREETEPKSLSMASYAPLPPLTFLTVAGVLIGLVSDRFAFNDAGDGKVVILFWTVYNLVILAVTLLVCVELPRREKHYADRPERVVISSAVR